MVSVRLCGAPRVVGVVLTRSPSRMPRRRSGAARREPGAGPPAGGAPRLRLSVPPASVRVCAGAPACRWCHSFARRGRLGRAAASEQQCRTAMCSPQCRRAPLFLHHAPTELQLSPRTLMLPDTASDLLACLLPSRRVVLVAEAEARDGVHGWRAARGSRSEAGPVARAAPGPPRPIARPARSRGDTGLGGRPRSGLP